MKSSRVLCLIAVSFVIATEQTSGQVGQDPPPREEQTDRYREAMVPVIGLHGSYDFSGNDWGAGAHVDLPVGPYLCFNPSGDIYMRNGTTWQGNLDASLFLLLLRPGGGLAIVDGATLNSGQAELG